MLAVLQSLDNKRKILDNPGRIKLDVRLASGIDTVWMCRGGFNLLLERRGFESSALGR